MTCSCAATLDINLRVKVIEIELVREVVVYICSGGGNWLLIYWCHFLMRLVAISLVSGALLLIICVVLIRLLLLLILIVIIEIQASRTTCCYYWYVTCSIVSVVITIWDRHS